MATFYNGGLIKAHDPRFGINHKYITDKLTKNNWRKRAIVRGGLYIYVNDYQKHDGKNPHKKELVYKIKGLPKKHKSMILIPVSRRVMYISLNFP